jgi:transcription elongation factor Elf1
MLEDAVVTCPSCWQQVSLDIDLSAGSAIYTEDCSVCCNPMTVRVTVDEDSGRFEVDVESESD